MRFPASRSPSMTPADVWGAGLAALPLCLLLAAAGPASASPPLFLAPFLSFDAGGSPVSVAVGDLNGDGKPDLAVANNGSNTVSVFLGNGDMTLGPKTDYALASGPTSVAIGDLNGDGKPDLVVANGAAVSVLLGTGSGAFGAPSDHVTSGNALSVAIGDLNGDGKRDVVAVTSTNLVSVFRGDGTGGFGTRLDYGTGSNPRSVAIGDLNGDGKPDVVVATLGSGPNPKSVSVLLGNGDGSLQLWVDYGTLSGSSVAIVDLTGDGKADLAVTCFRNGVSVLPGNGDGTFGAATNYLSGTPFGPLSSVTIGDLNADGRPDVAVTAAFSQYDVSVVSILLGNGNGTLGAEGDFAAGPDPSGLAIGDFDRDGIPDLVTANRLSNTVCLLRGNGDGTFGTKSYGGNTEAFSVAIGDLNGDGRPDVAAGTSAGISVWLGNGSGVLTPNGTYPSGHYPYAIAIGDLDGDGRGDIAVANSGTNPSYAGTVSVFLTHADGTLGPRTDYATGRFSTAVAIGDLNGDGKPDLVVTNGGALSISLFMGNGDGTFGPKTDLGTIFYPEAVTIADLNQDGKPDLVGSSSGPPVVVFLGNGNGTFQSETDFGNRSTPWGTLAVADLNGDGKLDVVGAAVLLGNGDGTFGTEVYYTPGARPLAVGDLNGDGKPDLAMTNRTKNDISVLLGNGDGTFGNRMDYGAGFNTSSVAIGDLTGEGRPEIVAETSGPRTVAVLMNLSGPVAVPPGPVALPTALHLLAPQPNPSRLTTELRVFLPAARAVDARLLDVTGRTVRSLALSQAMPAGEHTFVWDGRDDGGRMMPEGIYVFRVRAGREVVATKLVRLR